MRIRKEELDQCECQKCGYKWTPRKKKPKSCPECKSRDWDKDKYKEAE